MPIARVCPVRSALGNELSNRRSYIAVNPDHRMIRVDG
jgi:hypothetical protein